jgi:hypothetical protein
MREDMARVIVERPRNGGHGNRRGRHQEYEDLPAHEGMRRPWALRGDQKELNENLAPLRRYLARQVGRPWSKVYSEIAAHIRVDSAVQQHVRDHLRDFVAVAPRRNIGTWRSSYRDGLWWQELYVDPATDLLCRTDQLPEEKRRLRAKRSRPSVPVERIALAGDRELRLINGIWYELSLAPLPEPVYRVFREVRKVSLKGSYHRRGPFIEIEMDERRLVSPPVRDVASGELIAVGPAIDDLESWKRYRHEQPVCNYAVTKRVLSRRELRRHKISNAPPVD